MNKGFTTAILTITTVAFVMTSSVFISLLASDTIQQSVDRSFDDVNSLTEARMNEEVYESNIEKDFNYSISNAAFEVPEISLAGEIGQVLRYRDVVDDFYLPIAEDNLESRNERLVQGCSPPQNLGTEVIDKNTSIFELNIGSAQIRCEQANSVSMIEVSEDYTVQNRNNRFLHLVNGSEEFFDLKTDKEIIRDGEWGSGTATESRCRDEDDFTPPGYIDRLESSALSDARDDADTNRDIAEQLLDEILEENEDLVIQRDYIEVEASAGVLEWLEDTTTNIEPEGCELQTESDDEDNGDGEGDNDEVNDDNGEDSNGEGDNGSNDEDGDGSEDEGDSDEEDEGDTEKGTLYEVEAEAEPSTLILIYEFKETEREIYNPEGNLEKPEFSYNYTVSVD